VGGHHAAGEEMLGHPIAWTTDFKRVGKLPVGENVDEEFRAGVHPAGNFG